MACAAPVTLPTLSYSVTFCVQVLVPEGLGPGDELEVWVSDEEGGDDTVEPDGAAVAQATFQGQRAEELAAALNTSLEDLERARADVSGAVDKAREQEQLRSASEANAAQCVCSPLRPVLRSRCFAPAAFSIPFAAAHAFYAVPMRAQAGS